MQGKGKGVSLTPLYHCHPLHKHLDIHSPGDYCCQLRSAHRKIDQAHLEPISKAKSKYWARDKLGPMIFLGCVTFLRCAICLGNAVFIGRKRPSDFFLHSPILPVKMFITILTKRSMIHAHQGPKIHPGIDEKQKVRASKQKLKLEEEKNSGVLPPWHPLLPHATVCHREW